MQFFALGVVWPCILVGRKTGMLCLVKRSKAFLLLHTDARDFSTAFTSVDSARGVSGKRASCKRCGSSTTHASIMSNDRPKNPKEKAAEEAAAVGKSWGLTSPRKSHPEVMRTLPM
jgi:hypothetical protein